ncbi:MAG TPA: chemotaxis protein CheW [Candidatus Polarisedimenticolaceae bacterium]|nr:chemotaxis protein CheW [Candidatus Polarisedimenticolaceae bacterium]
MDLLFFHLDSGPYALRLDAVAEVVRSGTLHPVPLAGPAVRGLAERRGRPLAVIDLPRVLDDRSPEIPGAHLVRLAPPLEGTALWIPAEVFSGSGHVDGDAASDLPHVFIDGRLHVLLEPEALVRRAAVGL